MAISNLTDNFALRPVPRKARMGKRVETSTRRAWREAHQCAEGRICIYVMGPDDTRMSKVGVSITPYLRLDALTRASPLPLRMCYFAEVSKSEGFEVERNFLDLVEKRGERLNGEWISRPRRLITSDLRWLMGVLDITPTLEVGDTGEDEDGFGSSRRLCHDSNHVIASAKLRLTRRSL